MQLKTKSKAAIMTILTTIFLVPAGAAAIFGISKIGMLAVKCCPGNSANISSIHGAELSVIHFFVGASVLFMAWGVTILTVYPLYHISRNYWYRHYGMPIPGERSRKCPGI